jgi:hypothetical protein
VPVSPANGTVNVVRPVRFVATGLTSNVATEFVSLPSL